MRARIDADIPHNRPPNVAAPGKHRASAATQARTGALRAAAAQRGNRAATRTPSDSERTQAGHTADTMRAAPAPGTRLARRTARC
ncbi:hypothetical protein WK25_20220 [Burkholderia latens]|nr:hypothetical protein WK25_20220 [Burkholderia latens]